MNLWSGFSLPFPGACLTTRMTSVSSRCTWTKTHTACTSPFRAVSSVFPWVAAKGILPATSKWCANAHVRGAKCAPGHRFVTLLFCFSVNAIKGMITASSYAFWLMFSQSQMIIVHFPEWLNPVFWWCVCMAPGPALHQEIPTVAGSLTAPVRGYSRVFCEFKSQLRYKVQIL